MIRSRPSSPLRLILFPLLLLASPRLMAAEEGPVFLPYARGQVLRSTSGMVVSDSALASRVGAGVLRRGGNAVDAAVATALALAVTFPAAGNLGGGGFMLVRLSNGQSAFIDYREAAPRAAGPRFFLTREGKVKPQASTVGARAVGVPGTVAGLDLALRRYGTRPWRELVEPARRLAEEGFAVPPSLARSLEGHRGLLGRFAASRAIYLRGGRGWKAGERLRQPDLARTLARLQRRGAGEFYRGETARLLVSTVRKHGGVISRRDLEAYRPVVRRPLQGTYRGLRLLTAPPPSSGGAVLLETLNQLEALEYHKLDPGSPQAIHLLAEAMRRAYADRAFLFGDPAFVKVPVARLASKAYARQLARTISRSRASRSRPLERLGVIAAESAETTHFSVVDRWGNAVSNTYTLNGGYGSGLTVEGAGFLLNNEMDDFTVRPGTPNLFGLIQGRRNQIAPGKRPVSSMTPTILLRRGKLFAVLGSPGGPRITSAVSQVVDRLARTAGVSARGSRRAPNGTPARAQTRTPARPSTRTIRRTPTRSPSGLSPLAAAVAAPRVHHQWLPDVLTLQARAYPAATLRELRRRGHRVEESDTVMGNVQAIRVDPVTGELEGASDPRRDGRPAAP